MEPSAIPWFFHDSNTHLDDPQAPLPVPTGTTASSAAAHQRQSSGDKETPATPPPQPAVLHAPSPAAASSASPSPSIQRSPSNSAISADRPKFTIAANYMGSPSPNTNWYAFNPNDNATLEKQFQQDKFSDENIPVGLNRLFQVNLNKAQLGPIYWPPVGRTPNVHRATWLFSSSLTPIDPELELGIAQAFDQIKPYSATYISELESALAAPEAISKFKVPISYHDGKSTISYEVIFAPCLLTKEKEIVVEEHAEKQKVEEGEQETEKEKDKDKDKDKEKEKTDEVVATTEPVVADLRKNWPHKEYPVAYIFAASTSPLSYILPGSSTSQLITSILNGKAPSSAVFTVQRYFSWDSWKKLKNLPDRPTDSKDFSPMKVRQLVLVLHGIGQKLSQRVESFNFTYAINNFRISVNDKLKEPGVVPYIDKDSVGDGILVLPVNWRRALDFEQLGNPSSSGNDETSDRYSLKDITQDSIPIVRNLVNDVLLDIPYYMSKHRPLLVSAAVTEANRVYNLFLRHNPYFTDINGCVNIVAHSLGSLISLDILSSQPTKATGVDSESQFNFDTQNLFLVGSPVAFFLLMENAKLHPRALLDEEYGESKHAQYGSLAARSIYNVLHYSDPIAYLLNATVDPYLAKEKIEQGILPSERDFPDPSLDRSRGIMDSIASKLPSMPAMPAMPTMPTMPVFMSSKPTEEAQMEVAAVGAIDSVGPEAAEHLEQSEQAAADQEIPMVVELEDHDFKHEADAQRRMEMLNDNGQIDWVIPLTGKLENQYLSMIMAHLSYWDNKDFARMVAIECGRKKGPENALDQYKAKYKTKTA